MPIGRAGNSEVGETHPPAILLLAMLRCAGAGFRFASVVFSFKFVIIVIFSAYNCKYTF